MSPPCPPTRYRYVAKACRPYDDYDVFLPGDEKPLGTVRRWPPDKSQWQWVLPGGREQRGGVTSRYMAARGLWIYLDRGGSKKRG